MEIDIVELIKTNQAIVGTNETIQGLREGKLKAVYVTVNCPQDVRKQIAHYAGSDVNVVELELTNAELGVRAKRQHAISVIGILA